MSMHVPPAVNTCFPAKTASCVFKHKKCFLCLKTNLPPTRSRGLFASKVCKRIDVKNQ